MQTHTDVYMHNVHMTHTLIHKHTHTCTYRNKSQTNKNHSHIHPPHIVPSSTLLNLELHFLLLHIKDYSLHPGSPLNKKKVEKKSEWTNMKARRE